MSDIIGLRGEKARLVPVPVDKGLHLENALRWLNDPDVTHYLNHDTILYAVLDEDYFARTH